MLYFATLFDYNYLNKGLALYQSLQKHCNDFTLFVLCLDNDTWNYFKKKNYRGIEPISLAELELADKKLLEARSNRNIVEYYFTLSPVLPYYILHAYPDIDLITTLDADIYFYSNPRPIYESFKESSILITPHRFPQKLRDREIYGRFNVSFQAFRRDDQGMACLKEWRQQCLEWCFDRMEGDRFADQKYLDSWPQKYNRLKILDHSGAGLAPWNIGDYQISISNNVIHSNDQPLIFYHFHDLKMLKRRWYRHGLDVYSTLMRKTVKDLIYHPYINALITLEKQLNLKKLDSFLRSKPVKKLSVLDILENYFTLFNWFSLYTTEINVKKYVRYYRKRIKS